MFGKLKTQKEIYHFYKKKKQKKFNFALKHALFYLFKIKITKETWLYKKKFFKVNKFSTV